MSPLESTPETTILARWVQSQKHLESAMEEFYNATSSLATTYAPLGIYSAESKNITSTISRYTEPVLITRERLLEASTTLLKIRNESIAPINRLTNEVLQHIFGIFVESSQPAACPMRPPIVISSVCHIWREIALNTSSIWRYIIFDLVKGRFETASVCLERASRSLLDVTICDPGDIYNLGGTNDVLLYHARIVRDLLITHAPRFVSFKLEAQHGMILQSLVEIWLIHGTPGSVEQLSIICNPNSYYRYSVLRRAAREFIEPIQTLYLSNIHLDISHPFCNLLELVLDEAQDQWSPTVQTLCRVLAGSPLLRILKIRCSSTRIDGYPTLRPLIKLCDLRVLTLQISKGMHDLLPQIVWPTSNQVQLYLDTYQDSERTLFLELLDHWNTSYPSTFRLGDESNHLMLGTIAPKLANIDTFICHGRNLNEMALDKLLILGDNGTRFLTVEIAVCTITNQEAFRQMIVSHKVQRLRLIVCEFVETEGQGEVVKVKASPELDICVWLAEMVPDFKILDDISQLSEA